jgi:hypothetical protein
MSDSLFKKGESRLHCAKRWCHRAEKAEARVAELESTTNGMGAALRLSHPYKERAEVAESRVAELEAKLSNAAHAMVEGDDFRLQVILRAEYKREGKR